MEGLDIAIIGMAGRFPGAPTIEAFWENLKQGVEGIKFFSEEELKQAGISENVLRDPNYVKARGVLGDADQFDARLFDFAPREAEIIDPQHRVFMEVVWEALERAGYDPEKYEGLIGLFAGVGMNTYLLSYILSLKGLTNPADLYQIAIANDKDFLTTRVSYKLNLRGPSLDVQTACSTSLVAVHVACQNLLNYDCDIAIAGGVTITVPEEQGYFYQEGMILSPDGHCRPFDARAQGTVAGHGAAVVVLKRLADALEDGDTIYAVIKGSAVNNDGSQRVGYTAPSVEGQAEVIAMAQAVAGIDPDTIDYIECHGTGTRLGDPIEIEALKQVFQEKTDRKQFCAIGSVKSNVGHLDAAAGVTGLIKTTLAIYHRQIPPSINFDRPNPQIDFQNSPFFVNTTLRDWPANGHPRRAGVSSFGIGGTNAHVVLEEAPEPEPSGETRPWQLIALSAKSPTALDQLSHRMAEYFKAHPDASLGDVAFTLLMGRRELNVRQAVVVQSIEDARQVLESRDPKRILQAVYPKEVPVPSVVFMFSGQGAQYPNMGKELYETDPVFREAVDRCCELLKPELGFDLREVLYPAAGEEEAAAEKLKQTYITQPALFVIEYALAQMWMHWGVEPSAMIGHSIGEYVAACLAGVFTLEDALKLVTLRGQLMQKMPSGAMLSVALSEEQLKPLLPPELSLGAINSVETCVVSGTHAAVDAFAQKLKEQGVEVRRLHTSHAFHSPMMEPILEPFRKAVAALKLQPPQIPFISNVSGTWITPEEATDPDYWARHLRQTVRFADGVGELLNDPRALFLEVGPGKTLSTLTRQHPSCTRETVVLSSLRHPKENQPDVAFVLQTLARLWLAGVRINWKQYFAHEKRRRLVLPTYPFERQRYWLKTDQGVMAAVADTATGGKESDVSRWFYQPSWKRREVGIHPLAPFLGETAHRWLVFADDLGLAGSLIQQLQSFQQQVIQVRQGEAFSQLDDHTYTLRPDRPEDYQQLREALKQRNWSPDYVLHCWSVTPTASGRTLRADLQRSLIQTGFYSVLYLGRMLTAMTETGKIDVTIVTNHTQEVTGEEWIAPEKAMLLGPALVMPQEERRLTCRVVDVALPESNGKSFERPARWILQEVFQEKREPLVAFRGRHRWIPEYEPVQLNAPAALPELLKENGVYLITGGQGKIGMTIARYLARKLRARIVLVGRTPFPEREAWDTWLAQHPEEDGVVRRIRELLELEQQGAKILTFTANVANPEQMKMVHEQIRKQFGPVNGIFHTAGLAGARSFRTITETEASDCEDQFEAKVYGVKTLYDVFASEPLDFCLLFSSLSTVLGGLGFAAYSAANRFMDAFVEKVTRMNGQHQWMVVDWDGWQFEDPQMAAAGVGDELRELAMTPEEGLAVLERVLNAPGFTHWVVSTGALEPRLQKWVRHIQPAETPEEETMPETGNKYARPNLPTPYVAPRNDLEKEIASVWEQLLGIEGIGVHDNFFDLGGNSLSGTQLVAKLRSQFQVDLPLRELFEDPTIAAVAAIIERQREQQSQKSDKIKDLFKKVEQMSDEDVQAMLAQQKKQQSGN
ncbi:MAG: SDR family NAD(P)-dependent oxidoreductase [Calditrichaeota bacterium]|nr:SDR family NAD(P)-dependent oxidoreductase [Calditrichota bacterium]